jgi:predicted transport protein
LEATLSDIKLFRLSGVTPEEIGGTSSPLEKSLQTLIERHLETFLGVRFLATEFSTGQEHGGRMDTLGIDENGCPVIIEYKRASNENVINQGLFYLDWLMDHKKDFEWLVMEAFGRDAAQGVEWSSPRLLCIAGDFTKYDGHAVKQMNRNIELIRYRHYGDDLLLLDLVNTVSTPQPETAEEYPRRRNGGATAGRVKTVSRHLEEAGTDLSDLYEAVKVFLISLGDDVQIKTLKHYIAYRRIKNFACIEVHNQQGKLLVYVKGNPERIILEPGFSRDVRQIGHFGTGDLELTLRTLEDFERAKLFLEQSYDAS